MAKKDVPICFPEKVWAAARAIHSWACAQSPATSWWPARKKVVKRSSVGFLLAVLVRNSIFLDIGAAVGHAVLPAVKVTPVENEERHGANSCTLWWSELC